MLNCCLPDLFWYPYKHDNLIAEADMADMKASCHPYESAYLQLIWAVILAAGTHQALE